MAKQTAKKIAAKGADQYMLRLPPGMRDAVAKLAGNNGRSINTEIVAAIEQHLKGPSRLDALEAFIEKHRKMLDGMAEYAWFGKDGILDEIDKMQDQLRQIDERVRPEEYERYK